MKLRTHVKHCIMQYPTIFRNATEVYNHLFYVIGNGYEWKDGELKEVCGGLKQMTEKQCIKHTFEEHIKDAEKAVSGFERMTKEKGADKKLVDKLIAYTYKNCAKHILEDIEIIMTADKRADDFSIPDGVFPYTGSNKFRFYPLSEYSKCNTMPEDIKPDWKEGIEKINKIREEYESKTVQE